MAIPCAAINLRKMYVRAVLHSCHVNTGKSSSLSVGIYASLKHIMGVLYAWSNVFDVRVRVTVWNISIVNEQMLNKLLLQNTCARYYGRRIHPTAPVSYVMWHKRSNYIDFRIDCIAATSQMKYWFGKQNKKLVFYRRDVMVDESSRQSTELYVVSSFCPIRKQ